MSGECLFSDLPAEMCGCDTHRRRPAGGPESTLTLRVEGRFWQLWAKSITGVNLDEHCAKSLIGPTVPGLSNRMQRGALRTYQMPAPPGLIAWYVCGVSVYSRLELNAHLLAVPAPGETAHIDWSWGEATLTDARLVPILPDLIDPEHSHAGDRKYHTCRNWQAAWMIHRGALPERTSG